MVQETLNAVREAEVQAAKIIKDGEADSEKIVQDARQ